MRTCTSVWRRGQRPLGVVREPGATESVAANAGRARGARSSRRIGRPPRGKCRQRGIPFREPKTARTDVNVTYWDLESEARCLSMKTTISAGKMPPEGDSFQGAQNSPDRRECYILGFGIPLWRHFP